MTYILKDNDLIADAAIATSFAQANAQQGGFKGKMKQYILKVRDMPDEEKPREKLLESGPAGLTIQELLAVVLTTGTVKEEVMSMSRRVVKEYGTQAFISQTDPKKLSEDLDIPIVKACQIVACGELGRRFYKKNTAGLAIIRTPEEAYEYLREMATLPKEHLRGIYLDTHHRVIHDEVISIGTINSNIIHPREVFKPAVEYGAAAVILAHNHPSGIVTPSEADIEITKQLIEAGKIVGINLLDHIILTKNGFTSVEAEY
ncbi:MAG: DNA repair protein RadC [Candidatus Pacebacteria bacterium]|nr:DNA repair protein RadC [Candidatus Paceibacterota bacterium]